LVVGPARGLLVAVVSLDTLMGVDPHSLSDKELKAHVGDLARARAQLDAADAAATWEFDARALYVGDGDVVHLNPDGTGEKVGPLKLGKWYPGRVSRDKLKDVAS